MGSETSIAVPWPVGLVIVIDPPRASILSRNPVKPVPSRWSAPPTPSSRVLKRSVPSCASTTTCTNDAAACLAVLVSASETT